MVFLILCISFLFKSFLIISGSSIDFKNSTQYSSSLVAKIPALSAYIADGVIQLGREKLDPLIIEFLKIENDKFKIDLRNRSVEGLKNMAIDNVSVDATSMVIRISFRTDLVAKSNYFIDGILLSMPINGEGIYTITIHDLVIDMVIPFDIVKDASGSDVIDLRNYEYTFDVRDSVQFHLSNLYYGDTKMSDNAHRVLTQNWKLLVKQFGRGILNKVNDKIFESLRHYILSRPLTTIV